MSNVASTWRRYVKKESKLGEAAVRIKLCFPAQYEANNNVQTHYEIRLCYDLIH